MQTIDGWNRTRRNVVAICGILSASFLSGCRGGLAGMINDPPAADDHRRHWLDFSDKGRDPPTTSGGRCDPSCYLKGTQILTPGGQRPIEALSTGDCLVTGNGATSLIKWIGRIGCDRDDDGSWGRDVQPVRIVRGALGHNVPNADLLVSQNHRLYLGGILIRASDLLNGTTIRIDPCRNYCALEYYHILTESHHIIYANGATSETLLPTQITRAIFDNYEEYQRLHEEERIGCLFEPCAPIYAERGKVNRLASHFRSAVSPLIDFRRPFDIVRDTLAGNSCDGI
jgi:Hint domain